MQVVFEQIFLKKRHPLRISRGLIEGSTNLFLTVRRGEYQGVGEMAPGNLTGCASAEEGERILGQLASSLPDDCPVQEVYRRAREAGTAPCALAALDMALWDLLARQAGLPLYRLLGLPRPSVPTSVTVGINPPELVREQAGEVLRATGARSLKIKLGSPDGIEADQANFLAAREAAAPFQAHLRVDANGGWNLEQARTMLAWLSRHGADYVEQPLHHECDDQLPALYKGRSLPIFLDESCRFSTDIPKWATCVDGVNLKLMKCGGITEALRIVATARAFGLKTMIGCMGESRIAISAGASLGALFDHIDLDSHFNLVNDPADGAEMIEGVVTPRDLPGHGGRLRDAR
jgi:L-Ala-D/L-Glu epimerase